MPNADEIRKIIQLQLRTEPAGRLPSLREWASRLGAGTRTVRDALEQLVAQGILKKRSHSGYWRTEEFPTEAPTTSRIVASRRGAALAAELRTSVHPWNIPLPSVKEWARRWGCHRQTASRILEQLRDSGLLIQRGRSFYPAPPRRGKPSSPGVVLCVGASGRRGELRMDSDREIDFWKELGVESSRLGLGLRRVPWSGGKLPVDSSVVGIVASSWHLQDTESFYRVLDRTRVPVCVWIQDPSSHKSPVGAHPRLRFHDQGYGTASGRLLAAHLFDQGHARLAFLSPWHGSVWSRARLDGIREEANRRGCQVDAFCLDGISEWDHLAPAWQDPAMWDGFPSSVVARAIEGSVEPVREHSIRMLAWNRIRRAMEPLLEAARANEATAWVGANDECALIALDWLAARGEKRSVAGFDDTTGAIRADLTSFRFDSGAMVRSMLAQIVSDRLSPGLSRHEGMVVARGTDRLG